MLHTYINLTDQLVAVEEEMLSVFGRFPTYFNQQNVGYQIVFIGVCEH